MDWQDRSACKGMDPALWYPVRPTGRSEDNHGRAGKQICATCPVAPQCLEAALERKEPLGIWGGASLRRRRQLGPLYATRGHDYQPDCDCDWCRAVTDHLARLRGDKDGPVPIYGPGAKHGLVATYAKGCRCAPCVFGRTMEGRTLTDHGVDVEQWWQQTIARDELDFVATAKRNAPYAVEDQAA